MRHLRVALVPAICGTIVAGALLTVYFFGVAYDAVWYLAAGERLNAGHLLYALMPGDRFIPLDPPIWSTPSVYPPALGLAWQPLAALPSAAGLWLWCGVAIAVMSVWLAGQVRQGGLATAVCLLLLGVPIGETMATGNLNGLIMVAFGLSWTWRDRPKASGLLIGTLAAWKIFPGFVVLWMIVTCRWRAAGWAVAAGLTWTVAALVLIGPSATWTYLTQVVPSTQGLGISAAATFHSPVATYALILVGSAATFLARRHVAIAFAICVATAILAWPALSFAALGMLAGLAPVMRDVRRSARPKMPGAQAMPLEQAAPGYGSTLWRRAGLRGSAGSGRLRAAPAA